MNTEASTAVISRWRVTSEDRADLVFRLRDYFRRLGLAAEVAGPTVVEFRTGLPADEIETHVSQWSRVNGVPLSHVQVLEEPRMLLPRPPEASEKPRLGELLVRKGFITDEQLAWALTEAKATNQLLGLVLIQEKMIFEDELARTLSEQLAIPYLSIMRIGVNEFAARMLPAEVGAAAAAIPVRARGATMTVVFADPTDPQALSLVRNHLPNVEVAVAELSDIRAAWREVSLMRGAANKPMTD